MISRKRGGLIIITDMVFRKANVEDFHHIKDIFGKALLRMTEMGIDQWDEYYPNEDIIKNDIAKGELFAGYLNGIAVSAIVLNERQDPEYSEINWQYRDGKAGIIHRLCVHPHAQGMGIGRKTVAFIEKEALRLQCRHIRLDTFTNNPSALALYRSLGYQYAGDVMFRKGRFHCFEKSLCPNE